MSPENLNDPKCGVSGYWVYVLYSVDFDKIYVGCTGNLEARLLSHNVNGKKGWTLRYRPWALIHKESFINKSDALAREKQLKGS